jgi:hypothetical protein
VTTLVSTARIDRTVPFLYVETTLSPGTTLPEHRAALPCSRRRLTERLAQLFPTRRRSTNP